MGMGGICLIGESMQNLSKLIDKHEQIFGDQSEKITSLPTMVDIRMTPEQKEEKRRRQKRDWYHENAEAVKEQRRKSGKQKEWYANNRMRCIEKSKKWNKENKEQRKIITERYNKKGNTTWQCNSQKRT